MMYLCATIHLCATSARNPVLFPHFIISMYLCIRRPFLVSLPVPWLFLFFLEVPEHPFYSPVQFRSCFRCLCASQPTCQIDALVSESCAVSGCFPVACVWLPTRASYGLVSESCPVSACFPPPTYITLFAHQHTSNIHHIIRSNINDIIRLLHE